MNNHRVRNSFISLFVIVWLTVFHYESLRYHYLNPLLGRTLPKVKLLYPPAGWIMFFCVQNYEVRAEVYGQKDATLDKLDPHRIFGTRWLGYDNIHRNVLVSTLDARKSADFCRYLRRKFPQYDHFTVAQVVYACLPQKRGQTVLREPAYQC